MPDKVKIAKNSLQETLILSLCERLMGTKFYPELYKDPLSEQALKRIDYDFSSVKASGFSAKFGSLRTVVRQHDLMVEILLYLREYPNAAVVNLGCGLDPMPRNLDNGTCKIYNLDFPDVIAVRDEIFPAGEREKNIAANINNFNWFREIDSSEGAIFIAGGVFYSFKKEDAKALFRAMNDRFPGCRLAFDTCGKSGLRMMLKSTAQNAAELQDTGDYFTAGDPAKDIVPWSNGFQVSFDRYMFGYNDLMTGSVNGLYRLVCSVCDGPMQMKIVQLDFGAVRRPV